MVCKDHPHGYLVLKRETKESNMIVDVFKYVETMGIYQKYGVCVGARRVTQGVSKGPLREQAVALWQDFLHTNKNDSSYPVPHSTGSSLFPLYLTLSNKS